MARPWIRLLVVGLAYYGGARLGLVLALYNSQVTPFWPPTGIAMAAMLVWGRSVWPAVAVAAFAINLPLGHGVLTPSLISLGNVLAPVVAVTLLKRLRFDLDMTGLRDSALLVLIGGGAMLVSATVGVGALLVDGLPSSAAFTVWSTWWTGDAAGALLVTPFILCLRQQYLAPAPTRLRVAEACGHLGLTGVTTVVGFESLTGLRFLAFPVLAAAAVRFGLRGAAPNALLAALIATLEASEGNGLFRGSTEAHAVLVLQAFTGCVTFMAYVLAAMTTDRQRALVVLAQQGDVLEHLVEERTEALTSAMSQLAQAQQIARMGSYDMDIRTGAAVWSDEMYKLMQMPLGAPMSLEIYTELCHPDEREMVQQVIGVTLATGDPFTMDHRLRRQDGSYRWLHCQGQVVRDADGTIIGTRGTATDIEDRKGAESRFQQLVEMAPDAMVFVDDTGIIRRINQQAQTVFGYGREELLGQPLEILIPERFRDTHQHHRQGFVNRPDLRPMGLGLDLMARRRDGSEFPVEISLSPLETDEGTVVTASIRDVTDRKKQQDELAYRALHDSLTGLPNRLLLADRLASAVHALTDDRATAVVFLDVDRFKWVNDSLGHDAGDDLLRTLAHRLQEAVRADDTVARFGGDEFVVLRRSIADPQDALILADRLRDAVSRPVTLQEGYTVIPTVSVGITTTTDHLHDPAALLRDADAAMYRAKEQGRDRTAFFAPEIHAEMSSRLATAGDLRSGIESGQLRVHYQPIQSLEDGRPLAVEALVRWQHPERGLLLPADFIELAEETGQIGALDRAVILTACREFGKLTATMPEAAGLSLNVNVSLQHLSTVQLKSTLSQALRESGLAPQQLTVEVTESANLSGEQFAALLQMVKEIGAKVAIDDFGTGFSALSRLGGLAVDTIKVDRSFVTQVHTHERAQALVAAMTQLSRALDATVIAEGIEHENQAETLRTLGCVGGQGFLWSRALPLGELEQWLVSRSLALELLT